jgi:hypothetical protein
MAPNFLHVIFKEIQEYEKKWSWSRMSQERRPMLWPTPGCAIWAHTSKYMLSGLYKTISSGHFIYAMLIHST